MKRVANMVARFFCDKQSRESP